MGENKEKIKKISTKIFDILNDDVPIALGILFLIYIQWMAKDRIFDEDQLPISLCPAALMLAADFALLWVAKNKAVSLLEDRRRHQSESKKSHFQEAPLMGRFVVDKHSKRETLHPGEIIEYEFSIKHQHNKKFKIELKLFSKRLDSLVINFISSDAGSMLEWGYFGDPFGQKKFQCSLKELWISAQTRLYVNEGQQSLVLEINGERLLLAQFVPNSTS